MANRPVNISPSTIVVYVDESFFTNKTGVIQTALPIQRSSEPVVVEAVASLIAEHKNFRISEFKASKISRGNRGVYKKFLQYVANVASAVGEQTNLSPIVSVEGQGRYEMDAVRYINAAISKTLSNFGVPERKGLYTEVSQQIWWIFRFFDKICQSQVRNKFAFIFDNKHAFSKEIHSIEKMMDQHGLSVEKPLWAIITDCTNAILKTLGKDAGKWFPRLELLSFLPSEDSFFIQGSDVFSNLVLNSLKFNLGGRTRTTELKFEMLQSVLPTLTLDKDLLSSLELRNESVACTRADLSGAFQLRPE